MFTLSALPYAAEALEPHISAKTLGFHHDKHHQAYVDNLNKLISGTELETASLEEIIRKTAGSQNQASIFNNAAQVYNHDFFWQSLRPASGGSEPEGEMKTLIEKSFGSLDNFHNEFKTAGLAQFGSGYVWLVKEGDGLTIVKTGNADNPLAHGQKALLTVDIWEHSYYLDYQNRRGDFIDAVMKNLINWEFAAKNL